MLFAFLLTKILLSLLGHSENKPEKIRLAEKYFPDEELIWSETFEGKMTDLEIAEKSGHVFISAWKDIKGYVYLFAPDGKLLWEKNNIEHSMFHNIYGIIRVSISDSAETIGVLWLGGGESIETQVYDIDGRLISSHKYGVSLEVSPKGGYIDILHLYKKTGERVALREILKGFPIEKLKRKHGKGYKDISKFDFVSENELVILLGNVLYFYSFPEGELIWKSQKLELENGGGITILGKYILVNRGNLLYCFNKNGKLLWEKKWEDFSINDISLSSDEKYMAINANVSKGRKLLLCDSKTGEIKLSTDKLESQIGVKNFLCLEGKVLLSGYTGSYIHDKHKGYWTYILHFDDNWNIIDESYERGLVLGTSTSPVIIVYESDATGESDNTSVLRYENATVFNINLIKIRN